jgi:SRSO17 transposase
MRVGNAACPSSSTRDTSVLSCCVDETGDQKKGPTTEYVTRQDIGKLGNIDQGLVPVHGHGVLEGITFPLRFEVFTPRPCLQATECYQTKP